MANPASFVQSLIIASLLVGASSAATRAQDRWPPWQSYGEAEGARKPHLKRRPNAKQKAAPAQPIEQKTSAPPEPNGAGQTEQRPGKPPAVLVPGIQPAQKLTAPAEAKDTPQPSQAASPPGATGATNTAESLQTKVNPKIEIVPQIAHQYLLSSVAFSPDGTVVLSGGADMTVKLWDVATGALLRTLLSHAGAVSSVAFSPDGTRVLSGSHDKTMKLWEASTGQLLRTFEGQAEVNSVAFSPDGTRALSGGGTLKQWDTATGALLRTFEGPAGGVSSVAFSPDGARVLSGGENHIRVWNAATGALLRTFEGQANSVTFSPDGARVLSGNGSLWERDAHPDRTLKLWDAATGALLRTFEGHAGGVNSVAFSPDGARVLSGSFDNTLKLWDAATGQTLRTFEGHGVGVSSVAFSHDGTRVLSGGWENTLKLWDAATGRVLRTIEGHTGWVNSIAFSPDGTRILSGSGGQSAADYTLKLWDAGTGALLHSFEGHEAQITAAAFSPDGTRVLSGSAIEEGTLKLWDAATGQLLRTMKAAMSVTSVAFSPDGTRVLSGGEKMQLWDAATGALLLNFEAQVSDEDFMQRYVEGRPTGRFFKVTSVAFSPDGTRVLSGCNDKTIRVWDAATGALLRTLEEQGDEISLRAFSPDGTRVLSGGDTLKLWDTATGALLRTFEGAKDTVTSVAFSPDGTRVLSGSFDRTVRLWDAATGTLIRTFAGHAAWITSVAFSPDGTRMLSGSGDTTLRIWSLQTGEPLASMIGGRGGEWLTITPKGFFVASPKGAEMLAIVRGFEPYAVKQFYDHLYRHDLVEQLLKGDPEGKYADAASKLNLEKILDSGSAPQIEQLPERKTELINESAKVTVRLTDTGGGIGEKVVWRVNGVTQGELSGAEPQTPTAAGGYRIATQTLRIDPAKKNVIEITAYNGVGLLATEAYRIELDKFGVTSEERPRMYVVAVGVSDYAKSEWRLKFAANDAQTMGDTLKSVARVLYGEPKVLSLLDKDATAKGIEAAINSLQGEVKPADVFVLYVAGHGRSIAGTYYFLPQDLHFEGGQTIMSGGISQDMLQKWLAKIPAQKSILILDTCESAVARGGVEQETAIDRLQHATGRSVITAASNSAFEGYQGHGLLTYTILEELTKAEGSGNEEVTLSKLAAHVYDQVPAISQRVFGERQQPHNTIADDFPLGERVAAIAKPEAEAAILKTSTHVLIRAERVREKAADDAPGERSLAAGTQVRVVQLLNGWAVIAREGEKLGYVPGEAVLRLQ